MRPAKLIDPAHIVRSRLTRALRADLLGGRSLAGAARAQGKFTTFARAEGGKGGPVGVTLFRTATRAQGKGGPNAEQSRQRQVG